MLQFFLSHCSPATWVNFNKAISLSSFACDNTFLQRSTVFQRINFLCVPNNVVGSGR
jgi:hypothetical protein